MPKMYKGTTEDNPIYISMEQEGQRIKIILVRENGEKVLDGNVAAILPSGEMVRHPCVNHDAAKRAGLKLGKSGALVDRNQERQ